MLTEVYRFGSSRYPTELEKAIEGHLGSLRGKEDTPEDTRGGAGGIGAQSSVWTMELVSMALTGVQSQVTASF